MMKTLGVLLLLAGLSACSTSFNLDDVPVEDRSGTAVKSDGASGEGGSQVLDGRPAGVRSVDATALNKRSKEEILPNVPKVIYFDYDSYVVKSEAQKVVDAYAARLVADRKRKLSVEGHTDERGGTEYNLGLGQKRADAVKSALVAAGALGSQVESVTYGKERPAVNGADEAARAKNRRAEINY